jgi:methyl-accepting chemotaxis protein
MACRCENAWVSPLPAKTVLFLSKRTQPRTVMDAMDELALSVDAVTSAVGDVARELDSGFEDVRDLAHEVRSGLEDAATAISDAAQDTQDGLEKHLEALSSTLSRAMEKVSKRKRDTEDDDVQRLVTKPRIGTSA